MTWVKICGITSHDDAYHAIRFGADALGFNFFRGSPRYIQPQEVAAICKNLPEHVMKVGVFVNEVDVIVKEIFESCRLDTLQFHGDEPLSYCQKFTGHFYKVFSVENEADVQRISPFVEATGRARLFMLDTKTSGQFGGTGIPFNWDLALKAKPLGSLILSGGLQPENIGTALKKVLPYGVDVSSGLEADSKRFPGKKDPKLIRAFIEAVRRFDSSKEEP